MYIAIGCDHRGLNLKQSVIKLITEAGHSYEDFGCYTSDAVDYPDIAKKVAEAVTTAGFGRGILICDTGIGMSIVANRHPGIRAALCHNEYTAKMSRMHNNANVLILGARVLGVGLALDILDIWLNTDFEGGRHQKRLDIIDEG